MKTLLWLCPEASSADQAAVRDRYARLASVAHAAVANGFAGLAASEHHWRDNGYCPDALGLLTGLGARVRPRILMSAIVPLPFWDPRILAERTALASAVTGAEFYLGVGTGCDPNELDTLGWTNEELRTRTESSVGQLRAFAARGLAGIFGPPHLLLGAMTPAGVRRAARAGLGWVGDPRATLAELVELARIYHDVGGTGPIVAMRDAYIGDDSSEWLEQALADHEKFWATPRRGLQGRVSPGTDAIRRDVLMHGTAPELAAVLQRLRHALAPELLCLRIELPNWQDQRRTMCQLERWRPLLIGREKR